MLSGAGFWSAVAAWGSVTASVFVYLLQRRSFHEAARPELVLTDWGREVIELSEATRDSIRIGEIRNVGKGPAMHVSVDVSDVSLAPDRAPFAEMATIRAPIIAANEAQATDQAVILNWSNSDPRSPHFMMFDIMLFCFDTRGKRHETTYKLAVIEGPQWGTFGMGNTVATGVFVARRSQITRSTTFPVLASRLRGAATKARAAIAVPFRAATTQQLCRRMVERAKEFSAQAGGTKT